ncbi:MAG: hypothetical protein PHV82_02050 [Victivallaceae bacterium]|nr:hypothetical protein [Victivallaceae bacterium]
MKERCNKHIRETLDYVRSLIILADDGERDSEDDGCRLLYGVVRDCAYKMKYEAERERDVHQQNNKKD